MPLEEYVDSYDLIDILYCAVRGLSTSLVLTARTHVLFSAPEGMGDRCTTQRCQRLQHHDILVQGSQVWEVET